MSPATPMVPNTTPRIANQFFFNQFFIPLPPVHRCPTIDFVLHVLIVVLYRFITPPTLPIENSVGGIFIFSKDVIEILQPKNTFFKN